ncbi:MAG: AsmA family protein [Burkholderiales bacterium]
MRPLRWIAVAAAAVVALAVLGAVVAYATIDTQAIARYAADEVSRVTGRRVEARGPVSVAFWPRLAVVARDVSIGNPPGASRPEFARARLVRGAVATWPLLVSRRVVADGFEIEGLDVALETLPQGRGNWQFGEGAAPAAAAGQAPPGGVPLALTGAVRLVDAKVSWRPPGGGEAAVVAIPRFELAPDGHGHFEWRGTFEHDGTRWTLAATTGDPAAALRSRVPFEIDASLAGAGASLTAKGRAEQRDTGPAAVLDVALEWEAGSTLVASASPALAAGKGRLAARVDARDGRYALGGIAGATAGTKVDGNLEIDTTGRVPRIAGRLHADAVDLARLAATPSPSARAEARPAPGAETPPLAALARFDADLDFVVDRLRVREGVDATNARGRVVVAGGKLAAEPVDADVAGGKLSGSVRADAATGRGRVVAEGHGIEAARLLGKLDPGRNASGGMATFAVDLQGPAQSSQRFLAGASGSIRADVGPLRLKGTALDAGGEALTRVFDALNPFRRVDQATDVQCIVARLAVRDGMAHAERTLALETSRLTAQASGTIDLGRQTLDLVVRPRSRKIAGLPAVDLAEVVRVTGPIASPSVKLDTMGAAKTALTIGGVVASGGWGALATPLLSAGDDPNPCATARAGGKQAPAQERAAEPKSRQEDVVRSLRDLFKR